MSIHTDTRAWGPKLQNRERREKPIKSKNPGWDLCFVYTLDCKHEIAFQDNGVEGNVFCFRCDDYRWVTPKTRRRLQRP